MNKQESRDLDTWTNEIEQGFMQRGGWKACRYILGEIFNQRQEELERLQAIIERPQDFPEVVCLCGSTRFMDAFHTVGWELTLRGIIVLTVGVCKHAEDHGGEALGPDVADKLDELHKRKIDLADRVFVLNVDGYIGESTRAEIEYAKQTDKRITYLEPIGTGKS